MLELVLRVTFSLAVVLGLFWFVARLSQRRLGGARSMVRVLGRQALGRNATLTVVDVGGRVLVLGVGEGGVRLLTELDPDEVAVTSSATEEQALPFGSPAVPGRAEPGRRSQSTVAGSLVSAQTWKQAWTAATRKNDPS